MLMIANSSIEDVTKNLSLLSFYLPPRDICHHTASNCFLYISILMSINCYLKWMLLHLFR
jgi:hypothetical protein